MFKVILTGVRADLDRSAVYGKLATLFKTTPEQVVAVFQRSNYVLKSGLDAATAERYKAAIEAAGATCDIEQDAPVAPTLIVDLPLDSKAPELTAATIDSVLHANPSSASSTTSGKSTSGPNVGAGVSSTIMSNKTTRGARLLIAAMVFIVAPGMAWYFVSGKLTTPPKVSSLPQPTPGQEAVTEPPGGGNSGPQANADSQQDPVFEGSEPLEANIQTLQYNSVQNALHNDGLSDLRIAKNLETGTLIVQVHATPICYGVNFLVRLFDKNGNPLTHFTTQKPVEMFGWSNSARTLTMQFNVNVRDLRDAEQAEFGVMPLR